MCWAASTSIRPRRSTCPPGPLYGSLKRGEAVTLDDGSVVQASQVVGRHHQWCVCPGFVRGDAGRAPTITIKAPSLPHGVGFLRLYCSYGAAADSRLGAYLPSHKAFLLLSNNSGRRPARRPFRTAARDAQLFARVARTATHHASDVAEAPTDAWRGPGVQVETTGRFTLVPRSQAGYIAPEVVEDDLEAEWALVKERGLDAALEGVEKAKTTEVPSRLQHAAASFCFLGTGSAMPSKHRNVSGICLRCAAETTDGSDPGRGFLLDCGEGTLGQLRRAFGNRADECLRNLGAVWISHPHADHHLGLPSLPI